ncbi:hypothetical protein SBRY_30536 [Actinacidiphila bryophytorum]|uniref:Uncharacterized protein n=1 Tax=Actinacidiphila bryophytorum TaxID=1436133 RepID=A0A9W4H178_9ACTN|nr:hypothetical protein SBRY_30536 [Actinacidiphila bryophytorum]
MAAPGLGLEPLQPGGRRHARAVRRARGRRLGLAEPGAAGRCRTAGAGVVGPAVRPLGALNLRDRRTRPVRHTAGPYPTGAPHPVPHTDVRTPP